MRRFAGLAVVVALAPLVVRYPALEAQILIFGLLAVAFNLLLGEMGFLSFGQATFNGVGAYAAARALLDVHAPLLLALPVGMLAGALAATAIGALAITGRGVYGVMLTFAFNEMAYYAALQWRDVTGGDNGLRGLPVPAVFGIALDATGYYYLTAAIVLLAFAAVLRIVDSPFGAVLRAIRENEERARAIGYAVRRFKVTAFAISGALSGLAGALYAEVFRFVPVESIGLDTSTNIVAATVLGGIGSPYGALLGAAVFTILNNSLNHYFPHWLLLFGLVFCVVVLFFRGGLLGLVSLWGRRASHA